jgi:hypothetical protein
MEWLDDRLRVTIRDNGSGFDPDQAAKPTSLGLLSMRERAAAIGGTLEIASKPGMGTAVIFERPLASDLVTESPATLDARYEEATETVDEETEPVVQAEPGADGHHGSTEPREAIDLRGVRTA